MLWLWLWLSLYSDHVHNRYIKYLTHSLPTKISNKHIPALLLVISDGDVDLERRDLRLVDDVIVVEQRQQHGRGGGVGRQEPHVVDALDVLQ